MTTAVFDKATKKLVRQVREGVPRHDPATEVLVELEEFIDPEAQRWNGKKGVRNATKKEKDDARDATDPTIDDVLKALKTKGTLTPDDIKAAKR